MATARLSLEQLLRCTYLHDRLPSHIIVYASEWLPLQKATYPPALIVQTKVKMPSRLCDSVAFYPMRFTRICLTPRQFFLIYAIHLDIKYLSAFNRQSPTALKTPWSCQPFRIHTPPSRMEIRHHPQEPMQKVPFHKTVYLAKEESLPSYTVLHISLL